MEIINDFGIDPILLVAQTINFLVVLLILKKFLYKPVLNLLQKRQDEIKEGIAKADDAQKRLQKAILQEKAILRNANINAKKTINDANKASLEIAKQIQENAKKEAKKLWDETVIKITQETKNAEKRLMENVSERSIQFLEKALEKMFTKQQQEEVVKTALKNLKSIN